MKIGVVGDSHIPKRMTEIPCGIKEHLQDMDLIFHVGDINKPWVLEELEEIAPVTAVRGNTDFFRFSLPLSRQLELDGVRNPASRVIVFGHTHYPVCAWYGKTLLFNSGSIGPMYLPPGSGPKVGRLTLESGKVYGEVIEAASGKVICSA